jgi:large subunit ribosomal protein L30|tara:strand:- start:7335 stop:7547 length:213 start_codon:yes stop_codon:yes gene_type:complete
MSKKKQSKSELIIKLTKSPIGAKPNHRATIRGLGLRKLQSTVVREDNPCIRGMVQSVAHLVTVEKKDAVK